MCGSQQRRARWPERREPPLVHTCLCPFVHTCVWVYGSHILYGRYVKTAHSDSPFLCAPSHKKHSIENGWGFQDLSRYTTTKSRKWEIVGTLLPRTKFSYFDVADQRYGPLQRLPATLTPMDRRFLDSPTPVQVEAVIRDFYFEPQLSLRGMWVGSANAWYFLTEPCEEVVERVCPVWGEVERKSYGKVREGGGERGGGGWCKRRVASAPLLRALLLLLLAQLYWHCFGSFCFPSLSPPRLRSHTHVYPLRSHMYVRRSCTFPSEPDWDCFATWLGSFGGSRITLGIGRRRSCTCALSATSGLWGCLTCSF